MGYMGYLETGWFGLLRKPDWRRRPRRRRRHSAMAGMTRSVRSMAGAGFRGGHGADLDGDYGRKPSKMIWSAWRAALSRSAGVRTVQVSSGSRSNGARSAAAAVVRSCDPVGEELRARGKGLTDVAQRRHALRSATPASRRMPTRPRTMRRSQCANGRDQAWIERHHRDRAAIARQHLGGPLGEHDCRRQSGPSARSASVERPATRSRARQASACGRLWP